MNASRIAGLVVAVTTLLPSGPAAACGDKLSMMGGGVSFERINFSRHRGNVVMLLAPDSRLRAVAGDHQLTRSLEKAGHRVRALETTSELASVLQSGSVDVVLVDGDSAGSLQRHMAAASPGTSGPIVLTVVYKPDDDGVPMHHLDRLCVARADKHNGRQVLDAIEIALARKARGEPAVCGAAPPIQST
jgi:hypothetical protein